MNNNLICFLNNLIEKKTNGTLCNIAIFPNLTRFYIQANFVLNNLIPYIGLISRSISVKNLGKFFSVHSNSRTNF